VRAGAISALSANPCACCQLRCPLQTSPCATSHQLTASLSVQVELDGAQYFNQSLPFTITQLCWIEAILVGTAEIYRNSETDPEKRCYPGGYFDPLGLAEGKGADRLKEARSPCFVAHALDKCYWSSQRTAARRLPAAACCLLCWWHF
jgi:Chlorophyll A-B binding protein